MSTPHDILGVKSDATSEEIRKAYKKKAKQYHPDVNDAEDAKHKFQLLQQAYALLSDPQSRFEYFSKIHNSDPMQVYMERVEALQEKIRQYEAMKEERFRAARNEFRNSVWYKPLQLCLYLATGISYLTSISLLGSCVFVMLRYHPLALVLMLPVLVAGIYLLKKTGEWHKEYKRWWEN